MYARAIAIGLLSLLCARDSYGDTLRAAAKGKKQAEQVSYGQVSSFDGTTLFFAQALPGFGNSLANQMLSQMRGPQTMPTSWSAKDTEIVITLGIGRLQARVDASHMTDSFDQGQRTNDPLLARAESQEVHSKATNAPLGSPPGTPPERDLRSCTVRGVDQIVEKDPLSNDSTKPPVQGKLLRIANGFADLQRASDGVVMKYRLDDLSEVSIGICLHGGGVNPP